MRPGIRLNKMPDGSYTLVLLAGSCDEDAVVVATKGPMTRDKAENEVRAMYERLGVGAETAAYHGIDVRAPRRRS